VKEQAAKTEETERNASVRDQEEGLALLNANLGEGQTIRDAGNQSAIGLGAVNGSDVKTGQNRKGEGAKNEQQQWSGRFHL
jgi:hypothetical protein